MARPVSSYGKLALAAALLGLLGGCIIVDADEHLPPPVVAVPAPVATEAEGPAPDDRLNATLWMQQAVEYKATTDGIYALAAMRLDEALADPDWTAAPDLQGDGYRGLPPAIILDADETIIDNSPYAAAGIRAGADYAPETWNEWASAGVAKAIPGAVAFTRAAAAKGVKVFYVTNRDAVTEAGTARNLEALGFPMGGNVDTLLTKGEQPDWGSAKSTRWAVVAREYRILLMVGDNLGDFTDAYKDTPEARQAVYDANAGKWGREWIVLPNPGYGSWESAPFGHDYSLSADERRRMKREALQAWTGQP